MLSEVINSKIFNLDEWFSEAKSGNVLISFKGEITSEIITSLIEETENKIAEHKVSNNLKKISFHIVVESLQNLFHHGLSLEEGKPKFGAYVLLFSENILRIITGNYITYDKVQIISDRINQINSMSKDELKILYKLILNNEEFSEKGGGGLGMIDIARKTGSKLMYEFIPVDEKVLFYVLKINII